MTISNIIEGDLNVLKNHLKEDQVVVQSDENLHGNASLLLYILLRKFKGALKEGFHQTKELRRQKDRKAVEIVLSKFALNVKKNFLRQLLSKNSLGDSGVRKKTDQTSDSLMALSFGNINRAKRLSLFASDLEVAKNNAV